MKKILIAALLLFVTSQYVKAQVSVGMKGGLLVSKHHYGNPSYHHQNNIRWRPGFSAGLAGNIGVGQYMHLNSDFVFSILGNRLINKELDVKNTLNYNYLDWSLILRLRLEQPGWNLLIGFGPKISYMISGTGKFFSEAVDEINQDHYAYDLILEGDPINEFGKVYIPATNRVQFGLIFNVGYEVEVMEGQTLIFDLRYDMGHTFISKSSESASLFGIYTNNFEANNQVIALSSTFLFDLTKLRKNLSR
ncbi:MAG: outer membrane beta-barrel protein [Candidatus Cyclobacteriaceae bacterium M3_2C_046]